MPEVPNPGLESLVHRDESLIVAQGAQYDHSLFVSQQLPEDFLLEFIRRLEVPHNQLTVGRAAHQIPRPIVDEDNVLDLQFASLGHVANLLQLEGKFQSVGVVYVDGVVETSNDNQVVAGKEKNGGDYDLELGAHGFLQEDRRVSLNERID